MTQGNIFINNQDLTEHVAVFGLSNQGKSFAQQTHEQRQGDFQDGVLASRLADLMPPTDGRRETNFADMAKRQIEAMRLNAVRETFWQHTPDNHLDWRRLHDALVMTEIINEPSTEQVKAFFMMLPADIIGSALTWGFADTVVRERVYEFAQQNKQAVFEAIKAK